MMPLTLTVMFSFENVRIDEFAFCARMQQFPKFINSYFVQLLHFKEIKFRTFFQQTGKRIR